MRGRGGEKRGPKRKRREGEGELGWAKERVWAAFFYLFFLFFFCLSNSLIQTILIEFKYNLNSNLYTQHK
jgi:hypothetical protein